MSVTFLLRTVVRLIDGGPHRLAGGTQSQANTIITSNRILFITNAKTNVCNKIIHDIVHSIQDIVVKKAFGGPLSGRCSHSIFNNDRVRLIDIGK